MICPRCGTPSNPGNLFCQGCGNSLPQPQLVQEPVGMKPIGQAAQVIHCTRCAGANPPAMRYCNHCGMDLSAAAVAAVTPAATAQASGARVCWRCRAQSDAGAEFCKFCGARFSDAPQLGMPAQVARAPSNPAVAPRALVANPHAMVPGSSWSPPPPRHGTVLDTPLQPTHARRSLVSIMKDGSDGPTFPLELASVDLGRSEGDILLQDDPYLSARHARVSAHGNNELLVRDLDSINGVFVRLREPVDLANGDVILVGQQVLRFELLGEAELPIGPASQRGVLIFGTPEVQRLARLCQYTTEGIVRDTHYVYRDETVLGREQGDIVFTDDPFLSRRHAAITIDRAHKRFALRDLGSSNGTAARIRGERLLRPSDQFRIGRHLFRYDCAAG